MLMLVSFFPILGEIIQLLVKFLSEFGSLIPNTYHIPFPMLGSYIPVKYPHSMNFP